MQSSELKDLVVDALEDIKGHDIVCLDVKGQTDVADFMVVVSGNTPRQVKALADNVLEKGRGVDIRPLGVEGLETCEWVLVDLIDVLVHVMLPKVRDFYDLERLWSMTPGDQEQEQEPKSSHE